MSAEVAVFLSGYGLNFTGAFVRIGFFMAARESIGRPVSRARARSAFMREREALVSLLADFVPEMASLAVPAGMRMSAPCLERVYPESSPFSYGNSSSHSVIRGWCDQAGVLIFILRGEIEKVYNLFCFF